MPSVVAASSEHDAGADALDDREVPAAVFCTICGRTDCAGCLPPDRPASSTGTPWEGTHGSSWARLWSTARLATVEGETFFGTLEEGSVSSALGFAVTCELLAISSLALAWVPIVYAMVPGFVESVLSDGEQRGTVLAAIFCSVPALAALMVALHVLWAGGLELGLRLAGAPGRSAHCLRYALYSCGWDLVTSPFGFLAAWKSSTFRGATADLRAAVRIPRFATVAYIGNARRVPDRAAKRALLIAAVLTGGFVLLGAGAFGVGLVVALM
jgi:hypothetical protein